LNFIQKDPDQFHIEKWDPDLPKKVVGLVNLLFSASGEDNANQGNVLLKVLQHLYCIGTLTLQGVMAKLTPKSIFQ
jgi:hypothetical protein